MPIGAKRAVLNLLGMRDNFCRERIAEVLGRVEGVTEVNVSLIRARAIVVYESPCEPTDLVRAVQIAGYGVSLDGTADAG